MNPPRPTSPVRWLLVWLAVQLIRHLTRPPAVEPPLLSAPRSGDGGPTRAAGGEPPFWTYFVPNPLPTPRGLSGGRRG